MLFSAIFTLIPNLVEQRCVTPSTHNKINQIWKSKHYSMVFHDRNELDKLLRMKRPMFPNLENVVKCIRFINHEIDLMKLLLLWDYGGIVADLKFIMMGGNNFNFMEQNLDDNDEAFLHTDGITVNSDTKEESTLFTTKVIGSVKSHPLLYMIIQKFISNLFQQEFEESVFTISDEERRNNMLKIPMDLFFTNELDIGGNKDNGGRKTKTRFIGLYNRTVTLLNIATQSQTQRIDNTDLDHLLLKQKDNTLSCVDFDSTHGGSYNDLMLDIIDGDHSKYNCNGELQFFEDVIDAGIEQEFNGGKGTESGINRKIPRIVHMTSKSRCLTYNYTENVKKWIFPNHSIVFHDDEAVARLMLKDWTEFPQLHDARKCITSGAGMADLWRYLVLWEYGGIYTDIDNAPGPRLANGTMIRDEFDGFLEVEVGRFPVSFILTNRHSWKGKSIFCLLLSLVLPVHFLVVQSQYFIALSPHHPLAYFAVTNAMQRLYEERNIVQQYVPYITGPGALKYAAQHTLGDGYPEKGTHIGVNNRTITMVGHRSIARKHEIINRKGVSNHEYSLMNLTHYSIAGRQKGKPRKPCIQVLYEDLLNKGNAA